MSINKNIKYKEYLRSEKWKEKRQHLFLMRGKNCERCKSEKHLQIHHKTYERIFNERYDDLEILCDVCHKKEHGIIKLPKGAVRRLPEKNKQLHSYIPKHKKRFKKKGHSKKNLISIEERIRIAREILNAPVRPGGITPRRKK